MFGTWLAKLWLVTSHKVTKLWFISTNMKANVDFFFFGKVIWVLYNFYYFLEYLQVICTYLDRYIGIYYLPSVLPIWIYEKLDHIVRFIELGIYIPTLYWRSPMIYFVFSHYCKKFLLSSINNNFTLKQRVSISG